MAFLAITPGGLDHVARWNVVQEEKVETLRHVTATSCAGALLRISVVEHRMAFIAITPGGLRLFSFWSVIRKNKVETLRHVTATSCAAALIRKPVIEHQVALATISPGVLRGGRGCGREQTEHESG